MTHTDRLTKELAAAEAAYTTAARAGKSPKVLSRLGAKARNLKARLERSS